MSEISKLWDIRLLIPLSVRCAFGVLMAKETYVCSDDTYIRKYIVILFLIFYRIIPLVRFRY